MTSWVVGIMLGLAGGFVRWRIPVLVKIYHVKKLRRIVMDIRRIEGQFYPSKRIPNHFRFGLRERIIDHVATRWRDFKESTAPRSPEWVAKNAYIKDLDERKQNRYRSGLVRGT